MRVDILLVDDRPENLLALEAILEPLGQRLVARTSGDEALRSPARRDFAVHPPRRPDARLNGFETAALIKQREADAAHPDHLPHGDLEGGQARLRGYSVGAVDYIFKPFDPEVLRSKVRSSSSCG